MPRRKKHNKHGKNKHNKHQHNRQEHIMQNKTKADMSSPVEKQNLSRVLVISNVLDNTPRARATVARKDSFEMETPLRRIPPKVAQSPHRKSLSQLQLDIFSENTPVKTTPVNKRRSLNRQKESNLNNTWNATNLNLLFDSDFAVQSSDVSLSLKNSGSKQRSSSSIPKLHSPGKEKPLLLHKGTQTMDEQELEQERKDLITETPRVSQKILEGIDMSKILVPSQLNNSKNKQNQIADYSKTNEININPYLKEKQLISIDIHAQRSKWQKEGSAEELSFFSPQLFDAKSSSTPIQGLLSYLKDGVIKENLDVLPNTKIDIINNKRDQTPLREVVNKTPRSERLREQILNNSVDLTVVDSIAARQENVNLNTPPLTEKILDKDKTNSLKLLGSNKKRGVSRIQNRTSPKISHLVNHSRMFTKNLSCSRHSLSRRTSLDQPFELRTPIVRVGMYERMINRIKRYSKASVIWSNKMMESCAQLGIQIKNSLTSLCNMYNERSAQNCSLKSCNCESYKLEIGNLNVKIESLAEEVTNLRQQIQEYQCSPITRGYEVEKLREELDKVKQELANFTDLRSELTALKEQFHCFKNTAPKVACTPAMQSAAPSAPPPPPPPPPPMPPIHQAAPRLTFERKAKTALNLRTGDKADARPVISLDEILKVKLRKASERPTTTPARRPRLTSNPMSHDDLFRQVRLRTSRAKTTATPNLTTVSTPGGSSSTSSELSTSPASSLNRLLDNSSSVWRVKRLRKVGGYSFDSVHRRSPVTVRRDNGGS